MSEPRRRLRSCVEEWPECWTGGYDPRCCRWPKVCSADVYDPAETSEDELEPLPPSSWIVEYKNPYLDYPSFEPIEDPDGSPLVFASEAEAEAFIDRRLDGDLDQRLARWREATKRAIPIHEIYARRKAVLEAAGLWTQQPGEMVPLLHVVVPGATVEPPRREDRGRWRVVRTHGLLGAEDGS